VAKRRKQFDRKGERIDVSDQAIILFAHGARDPEWAAPFGIIKLQLQAARPEVQVELAFLDFMTPSLEAAVAQSAAQGAKRIVLVPLFMAQGGHLKQDLPLLVGKIRQQHPQLELQVMPAIGDAPEILQAISDWVLRSASV
jgi:sirohydrochlorin cobaltochelatase